MPRGPSSRAMLWASARNACLAPANAAKLAEPRSEAVAPVKMMVPLWPSPARPTMIEHQHFDGADGGFDLFDQRHHFFLLACVGGKAMRASTFRADTVEQGLQLVEGAPGGTNAITALRKSPGNGATGG